MIAASETCRQNCRVGVGRLWKGDQDARRFETSERVGKGPDTALEIAIRKSPPVDDDGRVRWIGVGAIQKPIDDVMWHHSVFTRLYGS